MISLPSPSNSRGTGDIRPVESVRIHGALTEAGGTESAWFVRYSDDGARAIAPSNASAEPPSLGSLDLNVTDEPPDSSLPPISCSYSSVATWLALTDCSRQEVGAAGFERYEGNLIRHRARVRTASLAVQSLRSRHRSPTTPRVLLAPLRGLPTTSKPATEIAWHKWPADTTQLARSREVG